MSGTRRLRTCRRAPRREVRAPRREVRAPRREVRARRGVTLLELILALGLSILVLGAVALAINVFLRQLDARRSQVEETQIARAVLRMIADDLRSAVQQEKLDFSQVSGSASTLASSVAAAAVDSAMGSSSGTGGSTGSTTGGGSSSGTGAGGGAGGAAGGSGNSGSGSSGGSSASGGSSSSGTSGSGSTSTTTQDIEQATETPPVPGIFGNQYQLMIDVSRLPRIDELTMQSSSGGTNVEDLPSDIKTVAYYVRQEEAQMSTGFTSAAPGSALGRELRRPGLVRRQLDRAVTMYATQGGSTMNLQSKEQLVAPEIVGVEFRYFDGTQWLTSWDSIEQNRLPSAVEIIVAVQPGGEQFLPQSSSSASSAAASDAMVSPSSGATTGPLLFRQIVKIPAARACAAAGSATSMDASAASDAATSSDGSSTGTSGTGTSGSSGTGASSGS